MSREQQRTVEISNFIHLDYSSKKLDKTVRIVYFDKYERVMEEFKHGNLDLITTGPHPFMQLRHEYPHLVGIAVTKDEKGRALYTCSVKKCHSQD